MKSRTFVSISILVVAVLIVVGSCANEKPDYISKDYEIYGTWVNPDYGDGPMWHPKAVFNPNGITDYYPSITATKPTPSQGQFFITNKWSDSKGNILYTFIYHFCDEKVYILAKISNSGKTLEMAMSTDYPEEMGLESSQYFIYNRQ